MSSLLYEIYNGDYDAAPEWDEKQRELGRKLCDEWDKVQNVFGAEFMDHIVDLEGEREEWWGFQCYRKGFCLGIRLMLEALTAATE